MDKMHVHRVYTMQHKLLYTSSNVYIYIYIHHSWIRCTCIGCIPCSINYFIYHQMYIYIYTSFMDKMHLHRVYTMQHILLYISSNVYIYIYTSFMDKMQVHRVYTISFFLSSDHFIYLFI